MKTENVVLGIPTTGNIHALLISLTAVLQGTRLPKKILIRSEGHFPSFAHFYLEQLADVARQKGIEFVIAVTPSLGLRGAVDWLLNHAGVRLVWMLADDVLPANDALEHLLLAEGMLSEDKSTLNWAYLCGNKQDVNNRRGWPDYSQTVSEADDFCPTYGNYSRSSPQFVRNRLLDNSHCLFNTGRLNAAALCETAFEYGFQSGGDDTLFGFLIQASDLSGWFCPHSQAFHLEKETKDQNFSSEPVARAESILRQTQVLGIEQKVKAGLDQMFAYCRKYGNWK